MKRDIKRYSKWSVLIILLLTISIIRPVTVEADGFRDVSPAYNEAVSYLTDRDYTNGISKTLFGTGDPITRGSAAIILANALELPLNPAASREFSDVPARAAQAISALKKTGIIRGKSATYFGFTESIKRGEMALMLSHAKAYGLTGDVSDIVFSDVNSRYREAVAGLVANNITKGKSEKRFGTDDLLKRGEFAVLVYRSEMDTLTKSMPQTYSALADYLQSGDVKSIKLIGDSITAGAGGMGYMVPVDGRIILQDKKSIYRESSKQADTWANRFRSYTEKPEFGSVDFFNAGISGKTAKWSLERVDRLVSSEEDVVFVMLGTNDRLIGDLKQYEQTIRKLLREIDERSTLMVVMAPPPSTQEIASYQFSPESINNLLKRISSERGYLFVSHYDALNDYLAQHPEISYEQLMEKTSPHPTSAGYEVMWEAIRSKLQLR
ncbi:S-layer homology domain-containing protein [Sporosarcina aquimarina]|uniref:S-layer homology domain-containing protein n=1 Tax=Sporosarcina aquimarina TaxID=114975 RepID=A0ABU4G569_9BACL|nr:S-layer homology domain-containing protein [Sporosarcina aquimarina]MDW0111505.1 S-layer homology domain-containing protein [Sporosarcina aquimarina]